MYYIVVVPVILNRCEVWFTIHHFLQKYPLFVKIHDQLRMIYGELDFIAKTRALTFWPCLVTTTETKLRTILCKLLYYMHVSGFYHRLLSQ